MTEVALSADLVRKIKTRKSIFRLVNRHHQVRKSDVSENNQQRFLVEKLPGPFWFRYGNSVYTLPMPYILYDVALSYSYYAEGKGYGQKDNPITQTKVQAIYMSPKPFKKGDQYMWVPPFSNIYGGGDTCIDAIILSKKEGRKLIETKPIISRANPAILGFQAAKGQSDLNRTLMNNYFYREFKLEFGTSGVHQTYARLSKVPLAEIMDMEYPINKGFIHTI